jgi:hypothetical protein
VQVRAGHVVTIDARTEAPIRSVHVAGTLQFDPDRDTRLDVGLVKIQAGDDASESGFDCEAHPTAPGPHAARPALEIGTQERPIAAGHSAVIRLTAVPGLDPKECPAIVCCGGRWDAHGSPLSRTWVKVAATVPPGSTTLTLSEPVSGWRVGDRVIVAGTGRKRSLGLREPLETPRRPQTEERRIRAIDGTRLELDAPLAHEHNCIEACRPEVANLSRNVVIESADPGGVRGHTMYHRGSVGSISYAEFRHLGKRGKLGKYSLHFHRVADSMRGSSVIGASIWDSANRWITIHGTNTLVVRDCVGYRSVGHGFFLEDGTEVENLLDRNLAIGAMRGEPLPGQVFPEDRNDGAGFWWANSHNAFTRNVAAECDQYGYRFDAPEAPGTELVLPVRGADGVRRRVDIRTLPFLRFEGNEAHDQWRYGLNLGGGTGKDEEGGVGDIGPDARHPFVIRDFRVWTSRWAITPAAPSVLIDGLDLVEGQYGFWHARYQKHAYRGVRAYRIVLLAAFDQGPRPDDSAFPSPLTPVDDRPPVTVMTRVGTPKDGRLTVRGTCIDDGEIRSVRVNGSPVRPLAANFLEWEADVDAKSASGTLTLTALAEDAAGNAERVPHCVEVVLP